MHQLAVNLLVSAVLWIAASVPAHAEKRVALVIGNAIYKHATPLKNPKNDADALSGVLEALGFEVVKGTDLTYTGMRKTLRDFVYKLEGADTALLFYAGHGLQVNGRNYLAPVDAQLNKELDLEFEALRLETILTHMEQAAKTNLVFLDACRDNPLARNLARAMGTRSVAIGRGLARVESGVGTMIVFATQPGNVAYDGEGMNSPFTAGLLKHIGTPGLDVALIMRRVRQDVINATGGVQVPWDNSSLTQPFLFLEKPAAKEARTEPVKPAGPPAVAASTQSKHDASVELAFWQAATEQGTVKGYEIYLERFPEGEFAAFAQLKIEALGKARTEMKTTGSRVVSVEPAPAPLPPPQPEAAPADPRQLTIALQTELKRVGCDPGAIDGVWGQNARGALEEFGKHGDVKLTALEPTQDIIDVLKDKTARVCPLVCNALQVLQGDQCVTKTCDAGQTLSRDGTCVAVVVRQPQARPPRVAPSRRSSPPSSSCIIRGTGGAAGDAASCGF